ncbi:MAG: branched-chain amino acid ABC transporter permease [Aquamicrobium sp.]|uniref:branched-chain amino acid ABC transporter permease n=1 Tax=Mesorhizobium sp. Pch-S TaxID=2082387 RepID=UPI0010104972|nr:branched-chain amino acid ABC transporter permease [Mesorhizobium sp. Pch-S]MBR2686325.1 branched-chain amino acid ABC transporter permease [Aquamicrobium sp.]QAZ44705.1 branched-chain amino acid ABC transporter permease [Mesorhizobium sp. Pch-S]
MLYFLQQVLNGLHSGALYALLAFGYALTNGILHRTNLAYGALFAFCGQTMILAAVFGYQILWLTLPATILFASALTFAYAAAASHLLARSLFEPLAESSPNTIAAATLGVALVMTELARIAANTHDVWLSPMLGTPVVFAEAGGFKATLTVIQLLNCLLVALVLLAGSLVLGRSRYGRLWRAVSDDPHAAAMCGTDVHRVFRTAVVIGGLCAALAGILAALYYGNLGFGAGLIYGLKVLFITAVGGYLSPTRAATGAAAYGLAESLWTGYFTVEWRDAWMFLFLVAILVLVGAGRDTRRTI